MGGVGSMRKALVLLQRRLVVVGRAGTVFPCVN